MLYKKLTKQYLKIIIIYLINNINLTIININVVNNYKRIKKLKVNIKYK